MAGSYTTEALVSSVRRRSFQAPTSDGVSFPLDTDIISMLNEEIAAFLVPLILSERKGHFDTYMDVALVAGTRTYTVPSRAIGADVSYLQLVDVSGNVVCTLNEQDPEVGSAAPYQTATTGQPGGYYFRGNSIVLVPTPSSATLSLRINYAQRPNQLVPSTQVLPITSFPGGAGAGKYRLGFTATAPSTFTSTVAYEAVAANPGFEVTPLGIPTAQTGAYLEFSGTLPSTLAVGDSIVLQETANVMTNIPAELFALIAQWVAIKLVEIKGTSDQLSRVTNTFKATQSAAREFLCKRAQRAHQKIVPRRNRGRRAPFVG